jgi:hypothetical protein
MGAAHQKKNQTQKRAQKTMQGAFNTGESGKAGRGMCRQHPSRIEGHQRPEQGKVAPLGKFWHYEPPNGRPPEQEHLLHFSVDHHVGALDRARDGTRTTDPTARAAMRAVDAKSQNTIHSCVGGEKRTNVDGLELKKKQKAQRPPCRLRRTTPVVFS